MPDSSANAASARVRAMYGKRLKAEDYKSMCSAKSVGEVAAYLLNTKYADLFSSRVSTAMHREQIEQLLAIQIHKEFLSLARFMPGDGAYIKTYLTMRKEQSEILNAIMRVYTAFSDVQADTQPELVEHITKSKLKTYMLRRANSYEDILKAAKDSVYYDILEKYAPKDGKEEIEITFIESELQNLVYQKVFEHIEKSTKGKEHDYTVTFFGRHIDILNYITVRRMKLYPNCTPEYIKKLMIQGGTLSQRRLDAVVNVSDGDELYEIMKNTHLKFVLTEDSEQTLTELCAREYVKNLRYSRYPAISVMSYLFLAETELSNIIKIIEGIRYSLDYREIYKMLIIQ